MPRGVYDRAPKPDGLSVPEQPEIAMTEPAEIVDAMPAFVFANNAFTLWHNNCLCRFAKDQKIGLDAGLWAAIQRSPDASVRMTERG